MMKEHHDRRMVGSWGGIASGDHKVRVFRWRDECLPSEHRAGWLPFGLGRSYGDSCLNIDRGLVMTKELNRFIAFDSIAGTVRCEAGISLDAVLRLIVPRGWFLPVVPGTRFVSVGGAIANDIHGKNHHVLGTFGCHVRELELLRSDGSRLCCSREQNREMFEATIGGLGLTGLITWAEIQLRAIQSSDLIVEHIPVASVEEFFSVAEESDRDWEYTVSWLDCMGRGRNRGRGIYMRGRHAEGGTLQTHASPKLNMPFSLPSATLNRHSVRMFNSVYAALLSRKCTAHRVHYAPFFFPLDSVLNWNRIYGRRGFYQYQFTMPFDAANDLLPQILEIIAVSGEGSFLAVLKRFGTRASPGLLSFPKPGVTLALDFRNRGAFTRKLFQTLDAVVAEGGGRQYPAKDLTMPPAFFQQTYPAWSTVEHLRDPLFSSTFWRRVLETGPR